HHSVFFFSFLPFSLLLLLKMLYNIFIIFERNDFMAYNFNEIEKKWQKYWDENETFKTDVWDFSKPKYYALDMFPYPSGQGLHVGHPEGYTVTDIMARMRRMQGYNV